MSGILSGNLFTELGPGSRSNRELSTDSYEDDFETDRGLSTPGSLSGVVTEAQSILVLLAARGVSLTTAYISGSGRKHAVEGGWSYLGLVIRPAISFGLHREPTKWDSQWMEEEADKRRRLFWEMYALEIVHCLIPGRPSYTSACCIDYKPPTPEVTPDESGKQSQDLWDIRYNLARDVYTPVLEYVSRTKSVEYTEIVRLSQELHDVVLATFNHYSLPIDRIIPNRHSC
ncbi:hypothetical protein BDM02DRAFT_3183536 [Thelephora ganbajun]|uniref:Uncharacterized protein n=1 Tax=Thelephora ganbajun TaxID=370292 RepID=A0ACB6ZRU6_THEGA|nr:hypothetical protein BDM02DRAFT_3183536 [Thelephora ganbajun]